jgi:uncharacterized membrane protein YbhN (UPF0104 family)
MARKLLSLALLSVFLAWAAWYVHAHSGDFAPLAGVRWTDIAALTLAFVAILVCNGLFLMIVTSAFAIRLKDIEWLSLSFASSFANYFLPLRGGAGLRAIYMSKLHGFRITDFVSTLSIMYLMHTVVNGVMALIGMGLIALTGGPVSPTLLGFFAALSLLGLVAMAFDVRIDAARSRFPWPQLERLFAAWRTVRRNRRLVLKLWVLMLALTLATVWQCRAAFEAVSVPLSGGGILVYAASKNLATLVSLTPGSLGVVEVISIYLGRVLGYSTSDALLVQGLIRCVAIVVLLLFGPLAMLFLQRHIRRATREA